MFWPLPYIPFSFYSKLHREWTTSSHLSKPSEHVWQEADTMRMLRSEDQNRGFDEKLAVLWWFPTAVHFIQVVVQKHTRNCQLDEQSQHVWQGCRYHADVQSKAAYRQNFDQLWHGAKTKLPSEADFTRRGWNIEFWLVVFKPYDIPLNNQQCFDFVVLESARISNLTRTVRILPPDFPR